MPRKTRFTYHTASDTWIAKKDNRKWAIKKAICVTQCGNGDVLDVETFDSTFVALHAMEARLNRKKTDVQDIGVTEAEAKEIVKQELGL